MSPLSGAKQVADRLAAAEALMKAKVEAQLAIEIGMQWKKLAQAAEARAEEYRQAILSALPRETLGAINYHFGPNARVAVSRESVAQYERIAALRDMALPDPRQERDAGAEG